MFAFLVVFTPAKKKIVLLNVQYVFQSQILLRYVHIHFSTTTRVACCTHMYNERRKKIFLLWDICMLHVRERREKKHFAIIRTFFMKIKKIPYLNNFQSLWIHNSRNFVIKLVNKLDKFTYKISSNFYLSRELLKWRLLMWSEK